MRRCVIVVIYNEQGLILPYVEILLDSIKEILHELVIVVNGEILEGEKNKLYRYTNKIFCRENIGYDGGAYKDFFVKYLKEDLRQWDEILLMNDTFYGPFFPWSDIFKLMEGAACDFWGLTCHPGGEARLFGYKTIPPHVQAYFIVVKKRMLLSPAFRRFWEDLVYPSDYKEAVEKFEIHFSEYFVKAGFTYTSWVERQKEKLKIQDNVHEYGVEERIINLNFPIYKIKGYKLQNYIKYKELCEFLPEHSEFPIEIMRDDIYRRCEQGKVKPYNPIQIIKFCKQYERIYLYGMGRYAKNLESFLNDNGIHISGYIISDVKEKVKYVYEFDKFQIEPDMGIIVALGEKNFDAVYFSLRERVLLEQMIVPEFD